MEVFSLKKEFLQQLEVAVKARFGEAYEVLVREVLKNNDVKLTAVAVRRQGCAAVPVIYVDEILQQIEDGIVTLQEGIEKVLDIPLDEMTYVGSNGIVRSLTKQDILSKVFYGIVNAEHNQEYLADKPWRGFLDLAVVYKVFFEETENYNMTLVLTNNFCRDHGIDLDELEEAARKNTEQRGFRVEPLDSVIAGLVGDADMGGTVSSGLWVCSLKGFLPNATNGACVLLYENVFRDLANKLNSSLYILPASIYEVLVLPVMPGADGLVRMVWEINRSGVVKAEDVLSDNVYHYDKDTREVTIVKD